MRLSWVDVPPGSDFPLDNLPYGIFAPPGGEPRAGVAIGAEILDLARLARAGLLDGVLDDPVAVFACGSLNRFLRAGAKAWSATRSRLRQLLRDEDSEIRDRSGLAADLLIAQTDARMLLPIEIGDYADFYSSIEHATNAGRIFRPNGEPLFPNYRWLPVAYHGRASTVVVSGSPIHRPCGQTRPQGSDAPAFGPSAQLDYELEVGFITGPGNPDGSPISTRDAGGHIFGFVLLNDWSARDLQSWETQPLGPFLSKSFATSISPWIVTLEALAPYRVANRTQEPPPLPHLRVEEPWAFDLELEVAIETERMRARGSPPVKISRVNFRNMYWNAAQQLAHLTSNGTIVRPADLYGSGTVSGLEPGTQGSLLEAALRGTRPVPLGDGEVRTFLEDGDCVVMRGRAERAGHPRIGFGELSGLVLPASADRAAVPLHP